MGVSTIDKMMEGAHFKNFLIPKVSLKVSSSNQGFINLYITIFLDEI